MATEITHITLQDLNAVHKEILEKSGVRPCPGHRTEAAAPQRARATGPLCRTLKQGKARTLWTQRNTANSRPERSQLQPWPGGTSEQDLEGIFPVFRILQFDTDYSLLK